MKMKAFLQDTNDILFYKIQMTSYKSIIVFVKEMLFYSICVFMQRIYNIVMLLND